MYEYEPLDRKRKEIRLLILQPGSGTDMLSCTLETAFLDTPTPPHYETISYVCGNQAVKATINLHGSETEVPATSEAALRRMRRKDRPRILWIDTVCINQNDIAERGHQVGMMYEIYTHTRHNCIYLGWSDDGSMPKVMESMEAIMREISVETRDYADFQEMLFDDIGHPNRSSNPFSFDIAQSGLLEFFQNSWFTRLWVVQEASLSCTGTFYSGHFHLPLSSILRCATWLEYKWFQLPGLTSAQASGIQYAVSIFDTADRTHGRCHRLQHTLYHFLFMFGRLHTFDRRDHVFALIALWQMHTRTPELPAALKPDYDLSVSRVFSNASFFVIQEAGDLNLLRGVYAGQRANRTESLPSWVPELDQYSATDWRGFVGNFQAHGRWPMRLSSCDDGSNILNVIGLLVDKVVEATPVPVPTQWTARTFNAFAASVEDLRPKSSWVQDLGGDIETRAGLVLQAGTTYDYRRATDQEALRGYRNFKSHVEDHDSLPPWITALGPSASDKEKAAFYYSDALRLAVNHRAVFYTKDGHMGLGPECTQPGDIVAILYGCQWPVVMRPLPTPGEYTFLECAYVYGIMDGEAVRRHKKLGREDDRFRII